MPGGAGGSVSACPAASGSRRFGWAVKLPETLVSTCVRPPSLTYESVTPWAVVIDADWPASSVPDAPVEPELASDELPVTIGTMRGTDDGLRCGSGRWPARRRRRWYGARHGTSAARRPGLLVVDVTNRPKSPLWPPAVLPAFAGRTRYEGAGGRVRSCTFVFGPIELSTTEVTPGVRMMVPPGLEVEAVHQHRGERSTTDSTEAVRLSAGDELGVEQARQGRVAVAALDRRGDFRVGVGPAVDQVQCARSYRPTCHRGCPRPRSGWWRSRR